jgi:Zn-dependent M28 family amino/carboxypeptidase
MHTIKGSIFAILCFFYSGLKAQTVLTESFFHPDSLQAIVEYLAADSLKGRFSGSEGCTKAAQFIAKEFQQAGLKPVKGNDGFFMPVTSSWGNVVGAIQGKSKADEIIIFSAHYDHIGTIKANPAPGWSGNAYTKKEDSIYNGANDDASGVSAVISLAKYFVRQNNNERTILFVAFAGEELGLLGSNYFSSFLKPEFIKAVVNIEMIGRKNGYDNWPYMTGADLSNLQNQMNRRLFNKDPKIYKRSFIDRDRFENENLFYRSDNYPFAALGVPAHTIMATAPTDPYYHSLSDEPATLDFQFMSRIVTAIAIACEGLVTGEDTPSRIKSIK